MCVEYPQDLADDVKDGQAYDDVEDVVIAPHHRRTPNCLLRRETSQQ